MIASPQVIVEDVHSWLLYEEAVKVKRTGSQPMIKSSAKTIASTVL